jgi:peptidoglycan/LPS O-acetylase OafA/YrhL
LSILCVAAVFFAHHRPDIPLLYSTWNYKELIANITLTQNLLRVQGFLSVLWTLPLEVQMYLFLPLLFIIFRSRSVRPALLLWLASIPVAILQMRHAPRLNLFSFAPCFLAGVVCWRLHAPKRERLPGWLWPVCLAAISTIWFAGDLRHEMYFRWGFCLALGFAIPFFAEISLAWVRVVAKTVAKYSYGIYLTHTTAMTIGFLLLRNHFAQWSVFLLLAAALPLLMYHLVEHPGIQAGKKIANWQWNPRARTPLVASKPPTALEHHPVPESTSAA